MSEIIVQGKLFHLRNARMSYVFALTGDGLPAHVYWGARLEELSSPLDRLYYESREQDYCHNTLELDKLPQELGARPLRADGSGCVECRNILRSRAGRESPAAGSCPRRG